MHELLPIVFKKRYFNLEGEDFFCKKSLHYYSICHPWVVQKIEGYALREQKKINVMLPPDVIMIKANDALLSQAMINIISNGIKYAHSNVDIAISKENHMVMIKIKDDGDGIPVQDLPHIFDRF